MSDNINLSNERKVYFGLKFDYRVYHDSMAWQWEDETEGCTVYTAMVQKMNAGLLSFLTHFLSFLPLYSFYEYGVVPPIFKVGLSIDNLWTHHS